MAESNPNKAEVVAAYAVLAEKYDKTLAAAFVDGLNKVKDFLNLDLLKSYLDSGDFTGALNLVNDELIANSFAGFSKEITSAFQAGAETSAVLSPPIYSNGIRLNVFFDPVNPGAARVLQDYKFSLIREITESVRSTIAQELTEAVTTGVNPLESARRLRQVIGLTPRQQRYISNYRWQLRQIGDPGNPKIATDILRRKLHDKRFNSTVLNAVKNGTKLTPEKIDQMVGRYTERFIKYRSEVIARTESIRALNMGNMQLWRDMVTDGKIEENRVERLWLRTFDGKTRDEHVSLGSKYGKPGKGVGLNEPFIGPEYGKIMYPGDPLSPAGNTIQCRCAVFMRIKAGDY